MSRRFVSRSCWTVTDIGLVGLLCGQDLQSGTYTEVEDAQVLEAFQGLRVAYVTDGMDMVGLPGAGLVDPEIHPDGWLLFLVQLPYKQPEHANAVLKKDKADRLVFTRPQVVCWANDSSV